MRNEILLIVGFGLMFVGIIYVYTNYSWIVSGFYNARIGMSITVILVMSGLVMVVIGNLTGKFAPFQSQNFSNGVENERFK